jgi:hypothetical protein
MLQTKRFLFVMMRPYQNHTKEFTMKCNVGKADRAVRFIVGIAIILAGVAYHSWLGAIGVIVLGTALIRFCPAYVPFSIDTSKNDKEGGCGGGSCGCGH